MATSSRRNFLLSSLGATAGALLLPGGPANAKSQPPPNQGGLVTGKPQPLGFKSIPGFLSAAQLSPHYSAHYGGALRGYVAADKQLQSHTVGDDLLDSSAYGAIQRARTSKANSVLLHELYFNGMSATSTVPGPALHRAIKQRFGSIDKWAADFQASAKAASGWAMLSQHSVNGKLYNVISDKHDTGLLWMATPLIVIDVYEHAFYVDYQNRKTDYIAGFMGHIDWLEAERRFNGSCAYKQVL